MQWNKKIKNKILNNLWLWHLDAIFIVSFSNDSVGFFSLFIENCLLYMILLLNLLWFGSQLVFLSYFMALAWCDFPLVLTSISLLI